MYSALAGACKYSMRKGADNSNRDLRLGEAHRNSASNKINGDTSFSIDEAVKVKEAFFPELSLKFLFEKKEVGNG